MLRSKLAAAGAVVALLSGGTAAIALTHTSGLKSPELRAAVAGQRVTLKWTAVKGAGSYQVARKTARDYVVLKRVLATTYVDARAPLGSLRYRVRAHGETGDKYSGWSYATVQVGGSPAPPAATTPAPTPAPSVPPPAPVTTTTVTEPPATSATLPVTVPAPPAVDLFLRPFAADSPWNTPLSASSSTGSASDPRTLDLLAGGTYINSGHYSIAPYVASPTDPLTTVTSTSGGNVTIRIPAAAAASSGTDANLTIIDPARTTVDEWWLAQKIGVTSWRAEYHVHNSLAGSGMEGGIRAAGFSVMGGLIRRWEADAHEIDHALVIVIPSVRARKGWVWPAISQDGASSANYAGSIPLGTRFAIPRSVDLNELGLTADGLTVARALQSYGGYVGDTTTAGNMILSAEVSMEGTPELQHMRDDLGKIRAQLRPVTG